MAAKAKQSSIVALQQSSSFDAWTGIIFNLYVFLCLTCWCLVGNEGMIHWLTINNHPSISQQPPATPSNPSIPYVFNAPVSFFCGTRNLDAKSPCGGQWLIDQILRQGRWKCRLQETEVPKAENAGLCWIYSVRNSMLLVTFRKLMKYTTSGWIGSSYIKKNQVALWSP